MQSRKWAISFFRVFARLCLEQNILLTAQDMRQLAAPEIGIEQAFRAMRVDGVAQPAPLW